MNTEIPALPINKTQKRLYAACSDPTFEHETFENMQEYLNNPTAYFGQILYCKSKDSHYRIAKNIDGQKILEGIGASMVAENIAYNNESFPQLTNLKLAIDYILANLTPETEYLKRYATAWVNYYDAFKEDPIKNDRMFFNAPAVIFVTSPNAFNGGLASSNMELMTDALGLGTFFSGFIQIASKDNKDILDLLGINDGNQIVSCLVIGYPNVKYQRTVPRKEASINWI